MGNLPLLSAAFWALCFRPALGQTTGATPTSVNPSPTSTAIPATCSPAASYDWSFNSRGQSPCTVASYLGSACTGGDFTIPQLSPNNYYTGVPLEFANRCRCSSVFYSLLSACAACQQHTWLRWSTYSTNCTEVYLTVFPESFSAATSIPHWAFDNVATWDNFNETVARGELGLPESTGTAPPTAAVTSPSSSSSSSVVSDSGSNAGAIAGGVVGGVVGLALVLIAGWLFVKKRRRAVASATTGVVQPDMQQAMYMGHSTQPSYSSGTPKYYDPSDPSTYPSSFSTSQSPAARLDGNQLSSLPTLPQSPTPNQALGTYSGAPEV